MKMKIQKLSIVIFIFFLCIFTIIPNLFSKDHFCKPTNPISLSEAFFGNCSKWMLNLDILYWKTCEDSLSYAIKQKFDLEHPANNDLNFTDFSKFRNSHYDWDLGYRLGIIHLLDCVGWDISLNLLYFHNQGHSSSDCDCPEYNQVASGEFCRIGPTWSLIKQITPEKITADLHLILNLIDIQIGRTFSISNCLDVRPFVGFRYGHLDQNYKIKFYSCIEPSEQNPQPNNSALVALNHKNTISVQNCLRNFVDKVRLDNKFHGIGPHIGIESHWDIGCEWSIIGIIANSILYGGFDNVHLEKFDNKTTGVSEFEPLERGFCYKIKDSFCGCTGITDIAIGLNWSKPFENSCLVNLGIRWEEHIFINFNKFRQFALNSDSIIHFNDQPDLGGALAFFHANQQCNRGDLTVGGLVFSARLEF